MSVVSLLKTATAYEDAKSLALVLRHLLLPFGGPEVLLSPGERVVLLADISLPVSAGFGVNTSPALLGAVCEILLEGGARQIMIAARAEAGFRLNDCLEQGGYWELSGERVVFCDLAESQALERPSKERISCESIAIYQPFLQADALINLPKLKAEEGLLFGSAFSNLSNLTPLPEARESRLLADLYALLPPDFTIVDCLKGQTPYQPQALSALLAGSDCLALDTVLAALCEIPVVGLDHLQVAAQYGLGASQPGDIQIYGDDLREIQSGLPAPTLQGGGEALEMKVEDDDDEEYEKA